MALTKVSGGILDPGINVAGIVTATGFDGPFTGGSNGINAGIITATSLDLNGNGNISGNLVVGGNFTANGNFTTLNTTLREVELLRVDANSSVAAGIITQTGAGDLLRLYDGTSQVVTVDDIGKVGIGTTDPSGAQKLNVYADSTATGGLIQITQDGTGDAAIDFQLKGEREYSLGIDNSDGDKFKLSSTAGVHSNPIFTATTGGNVGIGSENPTAKLDVNGHTELDNVNVSETLNVSGIGTVQSLSVKSNATNVGASIFSSASINSHAYGHGANGTQNQGLTIQADESCIELISTAGGLHAGSILIRDTSNDGFGFVNDPTNKQLQLKSFTTSGNNFFITASGSNTSRLDDCIVIKKDGAVSLFNNGTKRVATTGIGATVFGQLDTTDLNASGVSTATSFKLSPSGTTRLSLVYGSQAPSPRFSGGTQAASITSFSNDLVIRAGSAHTTRPYVYMGNTHKRVDIGDGSTVTDPSFTTHNEGVNLYGSVIRMLNGSVGIGTTNPTTNLHISGSGTGQNTLRVDSSGQAISIHNHSEFIGYIGNQSGKLFINAGGTEDTLLLKTNGNERLRITSDGYLGLGTTNPLSLLHVDGDVTIKDASPSILFSDDSGVPQNPDYKIQVNTGNFVINDDTNSETRLLIDSTGLATLSSEIATAQDYPTFKPVLDFNFAAQKKLDPRITFQRNGPASFTDKFGKVVLVGSNVPRFDHDPVTGECKGLLVEQFRTNYVRVSTNLESEWVAGSGSFARDDSITNPDGSVGAYYHTGGELYHQDINLSGANTNTITVSLWVKERSGQSGNLDIEIFQQISGSPISMGAFSFNPATQVLGTAPSTYSDGRVEEYPNGWYRISVKATTASGNFSSTTRFDMQNQEHYVWGMQIETGSFPTSFIPTYGETAARGIDRVEITEEEFSEFYNQTEGSIVSEMTLEPSWPVSGYASIMMTFSDNTYNNRITLASSTGSAAFNADVAISGSTIRASLGNYTSGSYSIKAAIAYKESDSAGSLNGRPVATTSPGTLPLLTRADIGKDHADGNALNGHIKRIMYYPKRLPNSQLVTLTS